MIDLKLLREDPEKTKKLILKKDPSFDIEQLKNKDEIVRGLQFEIEGLRKKKNDLALQGAKGLTDEIKERSKELGKSIKEKEEDLEQVKKEFKNFLLSCPNILQEDVPAGGKESNKVIKSFEEKRKFDFVPKNHVEINEGLNWFDMVAGSKITGSHFVLYKSFGAKLIYALTNLMLKNNVEFGFEPMLPPYMVKEECLVNTGILPKFEGDFYRTHSDLCLIPTAEVSLTSLHANEILSIEKLPLRYVSWTSCFRKEAGGYGATDRGLIRIHQFEKVEIFSICEPKKSEEEQLRMLECSQKLLQDLGLHYRVSLLAAQDCSFSSSKTYDIEVWLPGQNEYYEVSSCSNCTDFQSRRAMIRYRKTSESKPELVHTLNSSSLALPRLIVALMENYQQKDGSVKLPKILEIAMDHVW
ncbi:serine--tRNA ligase [Candidatus Babeliales bacterium]|nr:serine--tRNA ligase [Candidatus Babeliales bacterium]